MADTKISALAAVTDVLDTDEFVLARSGATKKIDGVDLRAGVTVFGTYTPTLSASPTPPTLGTGSSVNGQYVTIGKLVIVWAKIVFGSAGAAAGSGTYTVSLPVNFDGTFDDEARTYGIATLFDAGTTRHLAAVRGAAGTADTVIMQAHAGTVSVSNSVPWTWAVNDSLELVFVYKSA